MSPDAFIFDMDDLLIRSGDIWRAAEDTLYAAIGRPRSEEVASRYKGMNALDVAATIHASFSPALPLQKCQQIMRSALIRNFNQDVQPMPGAVQLVRQLHTRRNKPIAVASGSPLEAIRAALSRLQIADCFDQFITSESVARGKPHPDVFLFAAQLLDTPPNRCLVFEDSLVGVRAAVAGGMQVACIPSGPAEEIRRLTPYIFPTLADVAPELLA